MKFRPNTTRRGGSLLVPARRHNWRSVKCYGLVELETDEGVVEVYTNSHSLRDFTGVIDTSTCWLTMCAAKDHG